MKNLLKQSLNLTLPTLLVLLLGVPTQATASIDTSALVGSTAGGLSINQGAANYTIPITVPPGIAGMQPELSINYNSNAGNGQLGVGFSLGGSSIIHRCSKTIATDGTKGGVNYDSNDRYCIDGQRLIATAGTNGQASSEYHTEIKSFRKIKFTGNHWTVKTKSGQTFEYGNTDDSKIEAQGKSVVRFWAVNKITDAANNSINYVYNEDNDKGEYTLQRINYAGNSVRLTYEDRDDTHTSYQAGSKLQQTKRLSNITTYTNNDILRDYDLSYQYYGTPERSQLSSIEECVNGKCLPKTEFEWTLISGKSWQENAIVTSICANGSTSNGVVCNDSDNYKYMRFIDMNSDGKSDLVYRSDQGIQVFYSNGTSFSRHQSSSICANGSKSHGICNDEDNYEYIFYTDVNGDGNMDICNRADLGVRCHINTGTSWQENAIVTSICANGSTSNGVVCNDSDNYKYMRFIDMNSDGKSDLVYRSDQGIQVFYSNGTSFSRHQSSSICANGSKSHGICNDEDNYEYIFYTDVNGDGNMDICNRADLGVRCHDNTTSRNKLKAITNGFGIQTTLNYKPLTDSSVYTKDTKGSYPNINIQNARQVISSVTTDNAIGGQNTTTYKYGKAKVNVKGRGNLG
ncbi:SpvB/TcaC N-terminal domain-containing protein, partial [Bathymodiolus azoricus thioautotrophic gill symbiont]